MSAPVPSPSGSAPLSVDALVDATPASRDRYVDLLRTVSIAVVVLWHWVFSVTHRNDSGALTMPNPIGNVPLLWLATWLLQVMPLFFVVGGYANLAGWDAARRKVDPGPARWRAGRHDVDFLRSRMTRLLRPVVLFVGSWLVLDVALRLTVDGYRSVLDTAMVVFVPLWFLGVYAGVVLLVPITARLHHAGRELVPVVLGAAILLADLGRFRFHIEQLGVLNAALVFTFCHQLGYFWRDGTLLAGGARRLWSFVVAGLAALVVLTNLGVYPRSMVAVRGEAVSNMFPTTACIAALAVFQIGVALLLRPAAERALEKRRVWKATVAANGVAMTVFCWHMTAAYVVVAVFEKLGGTLGANPTASWWSTRPLWIVAPAVVLAGFVLVFNRFERPRTARA